jgi:cytochrome c oxidase assembly protein subunit 15
MSTRDTLWYFRRASRVAAVLAAIVVIVGAWVRLTQAGLGCPDWPGCYGHVHPAAVIDQVSAVNAAYPNRPFDYEKALHEMVHRYIATSLGILIIGLAGFSLWNRRHPDQPRVLPWVILGLVLLQGALGALTVTLLLKPLIVTSHLMGGLTTMTLLYWMSLTPERRELERREHGLHRLALVALAALVMQLLLGGWTSTNYAAVACPDFPTCQGTLTPATDYRDAFVLWRGLGIDYEGGVLSAPARTAIHYTHRIGAVLVGLLFLTLSVRSVWAGGSRRVRLAGAAVGVAVILQWLIGMNLIWRGFPLWLGTAHNAGAALLLLSTVTLLRFLSPVSRTRTTLRAV